LGIPEGYLFLAKKVDVFGWSNYVIFPGITTVWKCLYRKFWSRSTVTRISVGVFNSLLYMQRV